MSSDACVAVFARAPRAGHTKTRLIGALGAEGAATLYAAFLEDTLRTAASLGAPIVLWAASASDADALAQTHPELPIRAQPEGADLGERMQLALADGLRSHARVVLIGSDAPTLPAAHLEAAFEALAGDDAVLGPVSDGGYVLVGARGAAPSFDPSFGSVRWSSRHALADTRAAFVRQGLTVALLAPWYDVDTPDDLHLLRTHLALRPGLAPATAEALRRLGFDRTGAAG